MTAKPFVILYVEDDEFVRESIADLLGTPERRFVCVGDGAGARQALRDEHVSLLMTDVDLPDGSGLDVAREALSQNPKLPVVICSGYDLANEVKALGETARLMRKPVDWNALEALVEQLSR